MSEFQIGLLIVGAVIVAGVLVYNALAERGKAAGSRVLPPESTVTDAVLAGGAARDEPAMVPSSRDATRVAAAGADAEVPDPRLDDVVELRFETPRIAAKVFDAAAPDLERFRPFARLATELDGAWATGPRDPSARIAAVRIGLQLVSRQGAVKAETMRAFRGAMEALAGRCRAGFAATEEAETLAKARELDGYCAEVDIQIAIHLVPGAGAAIDRKNLAACAREAGLISTNSASEDWRFVDAEDRTLVELRPRMAGGKDSGLGGGSFTLTLDVPRCADVREAWSAQVRIAGELAAALGGRLVDDNDRVLDGAAFTAIGAQVERVRKSLEERGFAPGSPVALRLFS